MNTVERRGFLLDALSQIVGFPIRSELGLKGLFYRFSGGDFLVSGTLGARVILHGGTSLKISDEAGGEPLTFKLEGGTWVPHFMDVQGTLEIDPTRGRSFV